MGSDGMGIYDTGEYRKFALLLSSRLSANRVVIFDPLLSYYDSCFEILRYVIKY